MGYAMLMAGHLNVRRAQNPLSDLSCRFTTKSARRVEELPRASFEAYEQD